MGNAYGLIVGIAKYWHINGLPRTVLNDAKDICQILTDPTHCAYPRRNVDLLLDDEATCAALQGALSTLASRCNEESTVFFYISGHGGRIEAGPNAGEYILPVDTLNASEQTLARTALSGSQLTKMLRAIPARKVVVVFDTCFSGGAG